jgi:hypothetical protein
MASHMVEIALECWFSPMGQADQPITLQFVLVRSGSTGGSGGIDVHLRVPFRTWGVPTYDLLLGSSVDEVMDFAVSLQRLHDTMEGVAALEDTLYTDDSRVAFRAASRAAGVVEVGGRFYEHLVDLEEFADLACTEEESRFFGEAWGWAMGFRGLMVQREALARFVSELRRIRGD